MVSALVVDDDPITVELLELVLKRAGYEVLVAYNGEEALRMARAHLPDVIILNVNMPDLTGGEVCVRLKTNGETTAIPVVLCSAGLRIYDPAYVRQCMADEVLPKPCLPIEVIQTLERALMKKRKT
jgi:CheY-like chemotaxis protein